ncbi:unnamed protein product [Cyprideis torosa]|uniref:Uncharacterized protein n=1 Tax=Cyprideis torosa TaxID=163714 RepID=A0A7R8ZQL1_9CRUS|nr:unnamed protein product [Cyprideis torosa]CAG0892270.1 unnamed protein product [Cyprideis torosa]
MPSADVQIPVYYTHGDLCSSSWLHAPAMGIEVPSPMSGGFIEVRGRPVDTRRDTRTLVGSVHMSKKRRCAKCQRYRSPAGFSYYGSVGGKTGNSKGYAFIEFREPEVAAIVAETMNNYLMFNKLLKCEVVKEDRLHEHLFSVNLWKAKARSNLERNACHMENEHTPEQVANSNRRTELGLSRTLEKFKAVGIELKPEELLEDVEKVSPLSSMLNRMVEAKIEEEKLLSSLKDDIKTEEECGGNQKQKKGGRGKKRKTGKERRKNIKKRKVSDAGEKGGEKAGSDVEIVPVSVDHGNEVDSENEENVDGENENIAEHEDLLENSSDEDESEDDEIFFRPQPGVRESPARELNNVETELEVSPKRRKAKATSKSMLGGNEDFVALPSEDDDGSDGWGVLWDEDEEEEEQHSKTTRKLTQAKSSTGGMTDGDESSNPSATGGKKRKSNSKEAKKSTLQVGATREREQAKGSTGEMMGGSNNSSPTGGKKGKSNSKEEKSTPHVEAKEKASLHSAPVGSSGKSLARKKTSLNTTPREGKNRLLTKSADGSVQPAQLENEAPQPGSGKKARPSEERKQMEPGSAKKTCGPKERKSRKATPTSLERIMKNLPENLPPVSKRRRSVGPEILPSRNELEENALVQKVVAKRRSTVPERADLEMPNVTKQQAKKNKKEIMEERLGLVSPATAKRRQKKRARKSI